MTSPDIYTTTSKLIEEMDQQQESRCDPTMMNPIRKRHPQPKPSPGHAEKRGKREASSPS